MDIANLQCTFRGIDLKAYIVETADGTSAVVEKSALLQA